MRMIKYFAILLAATSLYAKNGVQYDLDYGDSITTNVAYKGANTNLVLMGYTTNRMRFSSLPAVILETVGDLFVSKPAPNWSGSAVSNLNMGTHSVSNVSSLYLDNIFINAGIGTVAEYGGVYSLGHSSVNSQRNIQLGAYGSGVLGSLESTSFATILADKRGSMIRGRMIAANSYLNGSGSEIAGYSSSGNQEILGNGSFLMTHIDTTPNGMRLSLHGVGMLMGGTYDQNYGAVTNKGDGSFGWGNNIKITNNYSYVFGNSRSTVLDYNLHTPWTYLYEVPWHTNHAVPMWWVKQNWTNATTDDRYVNRYHPNFAGASVSNLNMGLKTINNITNIQTSLTYADADNMKSVNSSEGTFETIGFNQSISVNNKVITKSVLGSTAQEPLLTNLALYEISVLSQDRSQAQPYSVNNISIISLNPKSDPAQLSAQAYITVNTNQIKYLADPTAGLDAVNLRTLTNSITNAVGSLPNIYVNRLTPNWTGPAVSNLDMGYKSISNVMGIRTTYPLVTISVDGTHVDKKLVNTIQNSAWSAPSIQYSGISTINELSAFSCGTNLGVNSSKVEIAPLAIGYGMYTNEAIISLNPRAFGTINLSEAAYVTINTNQIKYLADPTIDLDAVNLRTLTNNIKIAAIPAATVTDLREYDQSGNTNLYVSPYILTNIIDARVGTKVGGSIRAVGTGGYIKISGGNSINSGSMTPPPLSLMGGSGGVLDLSGGNAEYGIILPDAYYNGASGGSITLRGGSVNGNFTGARGGNIDLSGGKGTRYNGRGGDIYSQGLMGIDRLGYDGGDIILSASNYSSNTKSGGTIDTQAGYIELGGKSGSALANDSTKIRKDSANSYGTLHLPPVVSINAGNATVMTTRAFCNLDMANTQIQNLAVLPMPTDVGFSGVMSNAVGYAQITNLMYEMSLVTTPIGTIQAWGGAGTPPDGWTVCDGRSVSTSTGIYTKLFTVISTNFGADSPTFTVVREFNLPDLRGRFPRGVTTDTGRDPDVATRAASWVNGAQKGNVGSLQGDQSHMTAHSHTITFDPGNNPVLLTSYATYPSGGLILNDAFGFDDGGTGDWSVGHKIAVSANAPGNLIKHLGLEGTVTSDSSGGNNNETRPKNVYVNYIIRYR